MAKGVVQCCNCDNDAFIDGAQCPNDVVAQTGYQQDDEDWNKWYCPDCWFYLSNKLGFPTT